MNYSTVLVLVWHFVITLAVLIVRFACSRQAFSALQHCFKVKKAENNRVLVSILLAKIYDSS